MLGKLLKQDMKSSFRLFIPSILIFCVIFVLNKVMLELGFLSSKNNQILEAISALCMVFYIVSIIGFYIISYVFIVAHFYRTMSGEQGYLTHTLPVKTSTLINAKLLCAAFWQSITIILILFSFLIQVTGHIKFSANDWSSFLTFFRVYIYDGFFQSNMVLMISEFILTILIFLISAPLLFYASIALGHLFKKHKIMGAIISYIGIYTILQIITTISFVVFGTSSFDFISFNEFAQLYHKLMLFSILISLISSALFYAITNFIFSKRLNLE